MNRFLNHDGLAAGIFNREYQGATGQMTGWDRQLANHPELLSLMLNRMQTGYENLAPKMRKPWNQAALEAFLKEIILEKKTC